MISTVNRKITPTMISEVSRQVHLAKLADAIGYVIDTIDSDTTLIHEAAHWAACDNGVSVSGDGVPSIEELRHVLVRLNNTLPDLQMMDRLAADRTAA